MLGQFIFGRYKAAEELKMSPSAVYRYMKLLEENNNISIKVNNKFSLVSIVNWELYQTNTEKVNNKWTTNEQQMNTNKNVKNVKKEKNVSSSLKRREEIRKKSEQVLKEINGNGSKR